MDPIIRRLMENRMTETRKDTESPDAQYLSYLDRHRAGVRKFYDSIMLPILEEEMVDEELLHEIEELIANHDASKNDPVEFNAYRDYFYDKENHSRSSEEFNQAWNHHQKCNPHHWQYWVLVNDVDEPQYQPMDIPLKYIAEMLCDWHSAGNHYGNTAYEWYEKQKDKMILSENTRKLIEKYIVHFK